MHFLDQFFGVRENPIEFAIESDLNEMANTPGTMFPGTIVPIMLK
jgi:hypothetical protein